MTDDYEGNKNQCGAYVKNTCIIPGERKDDLAQESIKRIGKGLYNANLDISPPNRSGFKIDNSEPGSITNEFDDQDM